MASIHREHRAEAGVPDPAHQVHPLLRQALDALRNAPNIGAGTFSDDQQSRAAAALATGAGEGRDPLRRIDTVMMNRQGDGLIALEGGIGDPATRVNLVLLAQALNTPVQDSSQRVDAASNPLQVRAPPATGATTGRSSGALNGRARPASSRTLREPAWTADPPCRAIIMPQTL